MTTRFLGAVVSPLVLGAGAAGGSDAFECGLLDTSPAAMRAAVARGEISDPRARALPELPPQRVRAGGVVAPCLTPQQIFPFEDTDQILLTNFTVAQLVDILVQATNAMLAAHGDNYDFVGYWMNFAPHHTLGTAAYMLIRNDVLGIGDPSGQGTPIFDNSDAIGLASERLEGGIIMYNINSFTWQPGDVPAADFTRLALGQEYEHRFAMFLPDLLDGRVLQGDNANCGRSAHWSWRVDGQGSSMEISEWVGADPAQLVQNFVSFNTDIPGSIFSYTDLYLMGYVTPAEMDAGNSELRFMDGSTCAAQHFGAISAFSSADIIASAGPRVPDAAAEDRHYRTGWIMIHLPGDGPDLNELDKAVGIHEQHMLDWNYSTLGRGTMDNTLFDDCNCNGVPDTDECECDGDLDGNGTINTADLLLLLAAWGANPAGPPDLDRDGTVSTPDLLILLGNWGDCA